MLCISPYNRNAFPMAQKCISLWAPTIDADLPSSLLVVQSITGTSYLYNLQSISSSYYRNLFPSYYINIFSSYYRNIFPSCGYHTLYCCCASVQDELQNIPENIFVVVVVFFLFLIFHHYCSKFRLLHFAFYHFVQHIYLSVHLVSD